MNGKQKRVVRAIAKITMATPEQEWEEFKFMAEHMGLTVTEEDKQEFIKRVKEQDADVESRRAIL
jgi:hypothetical protein